MIYPSLYQSLLGMKKDDEDLYIYQEQYTKRLEQISLNPSLHKKEIRDAIDFIFTNKLLFPKEIDYAVLITAIEKAIDEFIEEDTPFVEPEIPEEIKGISDETDEING